MASLAQTSSRPAEALQQTPMAIDSICGEDVQTGEIVVFFFNASTGEIVGEIRCSPDQCSCS